MRMAITDLSSLSDFPSHREILPSVITWPKTLELHRTDYEQHCLRKSFNQTVSLGTGFRSYIFTTRVNRAILA